MVSEQVLTVSYPVNVLFTHCMHFEIKFNFSRLPMMALSGYVKR